MGSERRSSNVGLMGWMSVVLSLAFMIGCSSKDDPSPPAPVEITDISYLQEMDGNVPANEGEIIYIEGVATMGTGVMVSGRYLKFHIQDATGGAYVFADTEAQAAVAAQQAGGSSFRGNRDLRRGPGSDPGRDRLPRWNDRVLSPVRRKHFGP